MSTSPIPGQADLEVQRAGPTCAQRRGPLRRCRDGFLAAATALAFLVAVPAPAGASTSTSLLGHTSVPRIARDGTPGTSDCPAGSFAVGARIWLDTFPRVTGVATFCSDSGGTVSLSDVVGDSSGAFGDSQCSDADLATGLYGAFGEVMNALGVHCAGAAGPYDAARVGNPGTITSPADCPAGSALVGLTGWYGAYGSSINIYGVEGFCEATPPPYTVSGVLQPVNADGSSIFKAGRTVPVRFTATDAAGATVTDLTASLSVTMLTNSVEGTYVEADTNVAASTGFRYDATTGQYVYNWSTKGLASGTYRIRVSITNGPTITVDLSLG